MSMQTAIQDTIFRPRAQPRVNVELCAWNDLEPRIVAEWADLEQRALEPNAYLSPYFVVPAMAHLAVPSNVLVLTIKRQSGGSREFIGLGIFEPVRARRYFPLPHLSAFRSEHSYLTGILVDRDHSHMAANALFEFCRSRKFVWHGLEFSFWPTENELGAVLRAESLNHGAAWCEHDRTQRAVLIPSKGGDAYLQCVLKPARIKDLRRRLRRLADHGTVEWRVLTGDEISEACLDRFLDLEHAGWKGQHGTSLRSSRRDETFFREMIQGFASVGRAAFTELSAGEVVVASTSNLISGNAAFAFKVGWHPAYAKVSPGILNEVELVRNAPRLWNTLAYFDSGAVEDSYIQELWIEQRALSSGLFATTTLGRQVGRSMHHLRRLKALYPG